MGPSPAVPGGPAGEANTLGPAATEIVVDVSGKVRSPGLQRLPAGSRVEDALRAAGGVRPGANTEGLNRARLLVDGEQVAVGAPAPVAGPVTGGGSIAGGAGGPGSGAAPSAPVSLSTATVDQLDTLPGVGPVLARHIVEYWINAAKSVSTFGGVSLGGAARACSASKTRNTRVSSEPQVKVHSCG
ncbi:hypothetical protein GFH48_26970 [Streptomyces fagopyri]|uniref:Soluble ligand binding domain-containing protein n=1 Tax=Streptomyces fagopyri TaxID=2662397 RepID=A0A5Q0LIQ3_9ACTN|nr:hypothetical protein GFH48_26970 [Streptomyces fagopyri]